MQKSNIESALRKYVKENLSPTMDDIQFVAKIYKSFTDVLGYNNCLQIGSFPRYTAVRPLHDLDILYRLGQWNEEYKNPQNILTNLATNFRSNYRNPTRYKVTMKVQTHSISFRYMDGENEVFAVDIVPAMKRGSNEFGDDTFYVPEIIKYQSYIKRQKFYEEVKAKGGSVQWIKTDPLGYITVASNLNKENKDFRKSVKLIKGWKNSCKDLNDRFKLKSFHLEQLITIQFKTNTCLGIFDSIFSVMSNLKQSIEKPHIVDRADSNKHIDQYVAELSDTEIKLIHDGIDAFLKTLESFRGNVELLLKSGYYDRKPKEKFLFDFGIPVLEDEYWEFKIDGFIKSRDGYREYRARLSQTNGIVDTKNSIDFKIIENNVPHDTLKWKVKNDDNCGEPRGEISHDNTTSKNESTAFLGKHFVECYAILNNTCVAKSRADVIIRN
tara:strand:+ start:1872 stop:3191 length:1320 start_codon:yes stop_codon:yes gene_type:complete